MMIGSVGSIGHNQKARYAGVAAQYRQSRTAGGCGSSGATEKPQTAKIRHPLYATAAGPTTWRVPVRETNSFPRAGGCA